MKRLLSAVIVIILLSFSGCSDFNLSSDNLLSAPMLNKEQSKIYEALIESKGKNINIKYPKSGDNRTAFIIADLDCDGGDEAIAFYEISSNNPESGVRVNILDKIDGKWTSVYDIKGEGKEIDKVALSKINSKEMYIYIGYLTSVGLVNQFCVYEYSGKILNHIIDTPYTLMESAQIDDDSPLEVLLINPSDSISANSDNINTSTNANATILNFNEKGDYYFTEKVTLSSEATKYINIKKSVYNNNDCCIYLDAVNDNNNIYTDILVYKGGSLSNPVYQYPDDLYSITSRPQGYLTIDYNDDGQYEIPVAFPFLGYENAETEGKEYVIRWYQYEDFFKLSPESYSYYNLNDSYVFIIPGRWQGEVTVKKDPLTQELVFYKYEGNLESSTEELARIGMSIRQNTQKYIDDGYYVITRKGQIDYIIKLSQSSLSLTLDEAKNCFYVI